MPKMMLDLGVWLRRAMQVQGGQPDPVQLRSEDGVQLVAEIGPFAGRAGVLPVQLRAVAEPGLVGGNSWTYTLTQDILITRFFCWMAGTKWLGANFYYTPPATNTSLVDLHNAAGRAVDDELIAVCFATDAFSGGRIYPRYHRDPLLMIAGGKLTIYCNFSAANDGNCLMAAAGWVRQFDGVHFPPA